MESKIFNQDNNNPGHRKQKRPALKRVKKNMVLQWYSVDRVTSGLTKFGRIVGAGLNFMT